MYLSDALRVLAQRWWVLLIGAILTLAAAAAAFVMVPTEYQATGQVLLIPPSAPLVPGGPSNPFLEVDAGVQLTASLIANGAASERRQRELAADGFDSPYSVRVIPDTGPLILITVTDSDPAAALRVLERVVEEISAVLDSIQASEEVSTRLLVEPRPFAMATEAEVLPGARLRSIAAIGGVGVMLSLMVVFGVARASVKTTLGGLHERRVTV